MTRHDPQEDAIREEAAEWAVRLSADTMTPEQALALRTWCACDPRHAAALDFAQATWADLGRLGARPERVARGAGARPAVQRSGGRRRRSPLRWMASAAVLALALLVGIECTPDLLMPLVADYATAKGEVRSIDLPDGSRVDLDTRSAIDLAYDGRERRVRLLRGNALFSVAPMGAAETRPFVVESDGGTTRALGTRFVVEQQDGGARVGVLQHSVAVALQAPPRMGEQALVLEEGQSAHYDAEHGVSRLVALDLRRASGWQRGVLAFDDVPLEQVAEQLNRYRAGHIVIADRQLARRKVSGVFRLDSLDDALDTLAGELQAQRLELPTLSLLY